MDSSRLVDALLTRTQNEIIDLVFRGDGLNRNKVNLIVANEIVPHLTAEEYMDKGEYENEIKQVLGETRAAFDISQYDTLIFGAHGMLLTGPNSRQYEPLLCAYLQFVSLDLFIRNYYNRLNILQDDVRDVRSCCGLFVALGLHSTGFDSVCVFVLVTSVAASCTSLVRTPFRTKRRRICLCGSRMTSFSLTRWGVASL